MFTEQRAIFLYSVTPVHMGAGTAFGLIDNPIQREVHTNHPLFAGSGLKGAMRHAAEQWCKGGNGLVESLFGPESKNASEFAGAVSVGDGVLVAFPIRCLKRGYAYATSAQALARAARLLQIATGTAPWPSVDDPGSKAIGASANAAIAGKLILEAFEYEITEDPNVKTAAAWLSEHALPEGAQHAFFIDKLREDLVVLPEDAFGYVVERATVVEPHVRIDDATGTADDGGLFYTENLPPESLMVTLVMCSQVRRKDETKSAADVAEQLISGFDGKLLQIGGDATTGRGQVLLRFVAREG